jgi:hypothetical protein
MADAHAQEMEYLTALQKAFHQQAIDSQIDNHPDAFPTLTLTVGDATPPYQCRFTAIEQIATGVRLPRQFLVDVLLSPSYAVADHALVDSALLTSLLNEEVPLARLHLSLHSQLLHWRCSYLDGGGDNALLTARSALGSLVFSDSQWRVTIRQVAAGELTFQQLAQQLSKQ